MPPTFTSQDSFGPYFTLAELTHSQAATRLGLDNTPDAAAMLWLRELVHHVLAPLRAHVSRPVVISSGYRSKAVNAAVGGVESSQHRLGQAADIYVPGLPVAALADTIRQIQLPFDQLIDEFGSWVHVSYGPKHRRQSLEARTVNGKTVYTPV